MTAQGTSLGRFRIGSPMPYFTRAEDHYAGETPFHGAGGEVRIERQRLHWDILDAFADAVGEFFATYRSAATRAAVHA